MPVRVREGRWTARDMDTLALKEGHPLLPEDVQQKLGVRITHADKCSMLAKESEFRQNMKLSHALRN